MKKFRSLFLSLVLVLAMCIGLVACNGGGTPTSYTLTFDMNGQGEQVQAQVLGTDEIPSIPTKPEAEGYKFDGWFIDTEYSDYYYFDEPLEKNTTIYAKWTKLKTVSFVTNVSDIFVPNAYLEVGNLVNLPSQGSMVSAGKKFVGWFADEACTLAFNAQTTPITKDVTIYAKWTPYYKVTFDRNGRGSASKEPKAQEYFADGCKAVRPDDMQTNSYKFLGWSTEENGKNNLWDFDTVLTSSITLYAQWNQLFNVSFDLNNSESFIANVPTSQSVEDGTLVVRPDDPTIYGFEFLGWYTDKACTKAFDFETPITSRLTLYAKWEDGTYNTIDGEGIPEYSKEYQAAYGEKPDLEGYVIDGKMGENENWENQHVYTHTITDAPSISISLTTQFSEKGLYVFATAEDNGGIYWTGRNWFFQNTHFEFYITRPGIINHHDKDVRLVKIDSHNLYPSFTHVKAAAYIAEGEVNPIDSTNKFAQMNVEFFITWKELRMETEDGSIPTSVHIDPIYHYKRMQAANFTYSMRTLFAETKTLSSQLPNYLVFNANGYANADNDGAVIGDSSLGIAKTGGWDVSNANDPENPYVVSNKTGTQAIFYKNVSGNYYSFETEIIPDPNKLNGKAGVLIYNSDLNYSSLQFDVNVNTYNKESGFVIAQPRMYTTNKDGGLDIVNMQAVPVTDGKLKIRTIFNDGYIFYILNGKLIHCELVETLNIRTTPGLITTGAVGVKFTNVACEVLTENSVVEETSKYAYVVSKGRTSGVTLSFNTVGVTNADENSVTMYYQNPTVSITTAQKNNITQKNDFSGVKVNAISEVKIKTASGTIDVTADFDANASYGEYVMKNLTSDVEISINNTLVDVSELVSIKAQCVNELSGKKLEVVGTAVIKSSNPRLAHYTMAVTGGEMVLVAPKGYDYEIYIEAIGYRNYYIAKIENLSESLDLGTLKMTANIVGGTATNKDGSIMYASSPANWDMSTESLGYVDMSTPNTAFSPVFFSGQTIDKYQVVEIQVANTTDILANPNYEADPGAGFRFEDNKGYSYLELSKGRIRILQAANAGWNPEYVAIPGSSGTVDILPSDPYNPDTYLYTKFTVIKINKMCYCFVNDEFIMSVELYNRSDECAIAIAGHSSYYLSMRYKDYWIKMGDKALEYAKDKIATIPVLDDTCFDYDEEYNADYTKPYIKIDGLISVGEDENRADVAFIGGKITVSLTEHALENTAYTVSVGNQVAILSHLNSSFDIAITDEMRGEVEVSVSQARALVVSGGAVSDDGGDVGVVTGEAVSDDGKIIVPFTSGEDGTFELALPRGFYTVRIFKDAYACESRRINVNNEDINNLILNLYRMPIGGQNVGSTLTSSKNMMLGYGYNNEGLNITGGYMEANVVEGDSKYAINVGMMDDFVFDFTYHRKEVPVSGSVINETNPGIGVKLYMGADAETVLFYNSGVRILPKGMTGWSDRIEITGLSSYAVKDFNKTINFRIIRRNNVFFMYSKLESESEYNLIYTYESKSGFGMSEVYFMNTNTVGRPNRYFMWNISVDPFTNDLPDIVKRDVTIINETPSMGAYSIIGDTAMDGNNRVYGMGDEFVIALTANEGYIPAFVTVNGEYVEVVRNRVNVKIYSESLNIKIVFEPTPASVKAKLKVAITDKTAVAMPSTVDIYARIKDGRMYEFKNVAIENGEVSINIREGEFDIWADSELVTSKSVNVNVTANTVDLGTVTLDVLKVGSVTVNNKLLTFSKPMGEVTLRSEGVYTAPSRNMQHTWVPATKISGDFVFSTTVILSGNPNSNYYAQDNCTGVTFTNGTSRFAIQFWGQGFRVYDGIYNNKIGMIQPKHNGADYFSHQAQTDVEHTLTVARKGTILKVYVDGVYRMTLDNNGYSIVDEGASMYVSAEQVASVASLLVDVFGDNEAEIVAGYSTNINPDAFAGDVNKAGFKNTYITGDATEVAKYFN